VLILTVLDVFHIASRLALGAKLQEIVNKQAERELVLELVALVEEEHDRDVLQQLRLAKRLHNKRPDEFRLVGGSSDTGNGWRSRVAGRGVVRSYGITDRHSTRCVTRHE
jgi:hypothetical protein